MKPTQADRLITFENPLVEWESYQVIVKDDGSTTWTLVMTDPKSGEIFHWEHVPPVNENPYL